MTISAIAEQLRANDFLEVVSRPQDREADTHYYEVDSKYNQLYVFWANSAEFEIIVAKEEGFDVYAYCADGTPFAYGGKHFDAESVANFLINYFNS